MFFVCTASQFSCSNYVRWQLVNDIKHQRGLYHDKAIYLMEEFGNDILQPEGIKPEIPDTMVEEENDWDYE